MLRSFGPVSGYAEISHRTVEEVVRPLLEAEMARSAANWNTPATDD